MNCARVKNAINCVLTSLRRGGGGATGGQFGPGCSTSPLPPKQSHGTPGPFPSSPWHGVSPPEQSEVSGPVTTASIAMLSVIDQLSPGKRARVPLEFLAEQQRGIVISAGRLPELSRGQRQ